MSVADSPTSIGIIRWTMGTIVGLLGIAFAMYTCYSVITFPFLCAESAVRDAKKYLNPISPAFPPGSIPTNLGWFYMGSVMASFSCMVACIICACICIYITRRRIVGWILGLSGITISLASWPLGIWAIKFVIVKYHLVDIG